MHYCFASESIGVLGAQPRLDWSSAADGKGGARLVPQRLVQCLVLADELGAERLILLGTDCIPHIRSLQLLSRFQDGKQICR